MPVASPIVPPNIPWQVSVPTLFDVWFKLTDGSHVRRSVTSLEEEGKKLRFTTGGWMPANECFLSAEQCTQFHAAVVPAKPAVKVYYPGFSSDDMRTGLIDRIDGTVVVMEDKRRVSIASVFLNEPLYREYHSLRVKLQKAVVPLPDSTVEKIYNYLDKATTAAAAAYEVAQKRADPVLSEPFKNEVLKLYNSLNDAKSSLNGHRG